MICLMHFIDEFLIVEYFFFFEFDDLVVVELVDDDLIFLFVYFLLNGVEDVPSSVKLEDVYSFLYVEIELYL